MDFEPNRCRLVLIVNASNVKVETLQDALSGGDVASVIIWSEDPENPTFEAYCKDAVRVVQASNAAAIVTDSTQAFGRSGADGIFANATKPQLADYVARFSPQNIVGCGNIKSRHQALQIGELKPDFVFFGKLGGDIRPEPHQKNLKLAEWWSELVMISAILLAGNSLESVPDCAVSGVEFVALDRAVFEHPDGAKTAVKEANALLDAHAPVFEDDE